MCTAGQRVSLTITGPGPSFFVSLLFSNVKLKTRCSGTLSSLGGFYPATHKINVFQTSFTAKRSEASTASKGLISQKRFPFLLANLWYTIEASNASTQVVDGTIALLSGGTIARWHKCEVASLQGGIIT